jgi:hypothetical protein
VKAIFKAFKAKNEVFDVTKLKIDAHQNTSPAIKGIKIIDHASIPPS